MGPVQQKLNSFPPLLGLVVGAFNEGSEDVHKLVDFLAKSRVCSQGLREGRESSGQELTAITSQIRRTLSCAILKANVCCLLARVCLVGDGADQAGKRRRWVAIEEDKLRRERGGHPILLTPNTPKAQYS